MADVLFVSLAELLADESISSEIVINGLQLDSRNIAAGNAFVAIKGRHGDGREFVSHAVANGATVILVSEKLTEAALVPVIVVPDLENRLGSIAASFYRSGIDLKIIGVTGTNGKTTCTHLLGQLLSALDKPCGLIGTLGCGMTDALVETGMTTPDVFSVYKHLAAMAKQKAQVVAMEVSSHGLDQGRVDGVKFNTALITNLTRDHLDYHGDMQAYGNAKKKLFQRSGLKFAVVNADDDFTLSLKDELAPNVKCISYSLANNNADVWAEQVTYHAAGIKARINSPWGSEQLHCALLGSFNLSNVLAVVSLLGAWNYSLAEILTHVAALSPVPGRMQIVKADGPLIIVDYAHTPDALEQALKASRIHCDGQLRVVFGCGGDRDTGKRIEMGRVASQLSDVSVVTSDNPRSENPDHIIDMVVKGFANEDNVTREVDRTKAITSAVTLAAVNDCVLIAGKGHENYQETAGRRVDFSDVDVAEKAFLLRGAA